ncbi:MAG: hypothetical protein PVS3B3_26320 [Ktedonobacteraceae bacterium]
MSHEISKSEENFLIYEKIDEVRSGKLTRRSFAKMLTNFGLTAVGVGAIIATAEIPVVPTVQKIVKADEREEHNIRLHDRHLTHQANGNTQNLTNDYAHHAVVEDSMHTEPLVGRAAIMEHKSARMAAVSGANIRVNNRIARGEQVIVEWTATGIHTGDLHGLAATGRSYTLHGVTVVIRHEGKIVRESIYYDPAELHKQLGPQ